MQGITPAFTVFNPRLGSDDESNLCPGWEPPLLHHSEAEGGRRSLYLLVGNQPLYQRELRPHKMGPVGFEPTLGFRSWD